jgi:hypothetical protein
VCLYHNLLPGSLTLISLWSILVWATSWSSQSNRQEVEEVCGDSLLVVDF